MRLDRLLLVGIVVLAFAVRLIHLLQLQHAPTFSHETMDPGYNARWAAAIAAGQSFVEGPYFRAPLYAWFLGGLFKLTGGSYFAARLIQMVVGAISCGLCFWIGRRLFPLWVAAAAGFVAAVYWPLVYFDGELLDPVVAIFLNLVAIAGLLRWGRGPSARAAILPGLAIGLSALARPNVLLFAPFAALWMLLARSAGRARIASATVFALAVIVPIIPVTIRNASHGDPVLIASQGGVNFYIGNNAEANGTEVFVPGVPRTLEGIYEESHALAEQKLGRKLRPSESSDYFFREGLRFIAAQPGKALSLFARKLGYFWTGREITNERNLAFVLKRYTPFTDALPIGFWAVGPLGLAGLVACWPRRRELFPLWGFVLAYTASVILFFVTARFRLPVVPVLILLAFYALAAAREAVGAGNRKLVAAQAGAVVVGVALLLGGPATSESRSAKSLTETARVLRDQGRLREAEEMLQEAIRVDPRYVDAHASLGVLYQSMNQPERAEASFRQALAVDPGNAKVMDSLGAFLLSKGRTAEGIGVLEHAVAIDPKDWSALVNLAKGYAILRRFAESVAAYEKALAVNPQMPEALIHLAWMRASIDDPRVLDGQAARRAAEEAVRLTQRKDHRALNVLAAAQARCGDFPGAVATTEEAMRIAEARGDRREAARIAQLREAYLKGNAPLVGVSAGSP